MDSLIFSLREIEHTGGRFASSDRSGPGRNSKSKHPRAQRRRSSDTATAHGGGHDGEGFPGGQYPITFIVNLFRMLYTCQPHRH